MPTGQPQSRFEMKSYLIPGVVLVGMLFSAMAFAAATDRFKGASYDGYDRISFVQTSGTNLYPLINARFTGGSYDGYDLNSVTNTVFPPVRATGTVFRFK